MEKEFGKRANNIGKEPRRFFVDLDIPMITDDDEGAKISVDIIIHGEDEKKTSLWYKVKHIYCEYLYSDRVDPFLVAILPYCMEKGYSIKISKKTGVSADLLYQITKILIPSLVKVKEYNFHSIDIDAVPIYKNLKKGTGVATGVSRGIDSFYTILNHLDGLFPLTHLTLFNVQSFGEYGGKGARNYFVKEIEEAKNICDALNQEHGLDLDLVTVDSNIQDVFPIAISRSGSYRDVGAVLLLKQMFKLYIFSADVKLDDFKLGISTRRDNPWIFYCLSTENYRIQLFGANVSRMEKADFISRFPITYENLRVCLQPLVYGNKGEEYQSHMNCTCDCEKCRYTVMELRASGGLEKYAKVFDVDWVEQNCEDLLAESIVRKEILPHWKGIYETYKQRGEIDEKLEEKVRMGEFDVLPDEREHRIVTLTTHLLQRAQDQPSLMERLTKNGYRSVAIYGMGRLGKQLYDQLKNIVAYGIDRNTEINCKNFSLKSLDEELPAVDLTIITTVYDRKAIRNVLSKKLECKIMTLEEVLEMD